MARVDGNGRIGLSAVGVALALGALGPASGRPWAGTVGWVVAAVCWAVAAALFVTVGASWWRSRKKPPAEPPPLPPHPRGTGIRIRNVRDLKSRRNVFIGLDQAWDVEDVEDWDQGEDTIIGPGVPEEDDSPSP